MEKTAGPGHQRAVLFGLLAAAALMAACAKPVRTTDVVVEGKQYRPASIEVDQFSQVNFKNLDAVEHTVTEIPAKGSGTALPNFDQTLSPDGGSITIGFQVKGTVEYQCVIHKFKGKISVK